MSADVVVPVFRDVALTRACLRSVLQLSGPALARLIVVNDASPEPEMAALLEDFRREDPRVRVLTNAQNCGFVISANLGMAIGSTEVVLLNSDTRVTAGWLDELLGALLEDPKLAALSPLSNNATLCSVPDFGLAVPLETLDGLTLPLSGLPRVTPMPTVNGFCMVLRRSVLDALGLFDRKYGRGYNEENDWCQRARADGWKVGRANRALVLHHGDVSFLGARSRLDVLNGRRLVARYPAYIEENRAFEAGPRARVAARAVRCALARLNVRAPAEPAFAQAITARFGAHQGSPDVSCVRGIGSWDARGVLLTLLDAHTPLTDPRLADQLTHSEAIVTDSAELKAQLEQSFGVEQTKVTAVPATAPDQLLGIIERSVLRPTP